MSTHHSFNTEHARLYGLREAVLISNLHYWVSHNYANGTHEHDGRTWTYNSVKAFEDLFPYLTYKQIRTSLETLITLDVLVRGNYNKKPADRTSWFAFTDEFLGNNPLPKRANVAPKKEKPLPPRANGVPPRANGSAQEGKSLEEPDVTPAVTPNQYPADADDGFVQPPMTGAVCMVMKACGMQGVNPSHPDLKILIDNGADIGLFVEAARKCVEGKKPFNYALTIVKNQMKAAAALADSALAAPAYKTAPAPRRTPAPENFNPNVYGQGGKL